MDRHEVNGLARIGTAVFGIAAVGGILAAVAPSWFPGLPTVLTVACVGVWAATRRTR